MAKKWYPVIDYLLCQECGTCSGMCPHDVYDRNAAPAPRVACPENCIDHCHGCGNQCPVGAIAYVGEDTDWVPPARKGRKSRNVDCGCSGSCG